MKMVCFHMRNVLLASALLLVTNSICDGAALPVPHDYLEGHRYQLHQELLELVAIPTVSSKYEHNQDIQRATKWLESKLREIGMKVRRAQDRAELAVSATGRAHSNEQRWRKTQNVTIMPTDGPRPTVYADHLLAGPDALTVLVRPRPLCPRPGTQCCLLLNWSACCCMTSTSTLRGSAYARLP